MKKTPNVVILGATSAIAEAAAREWAKQHAHLVLFARSAANLEAVANDLRIRGATVSTFVADLATADPQDMLARAARGLGVIDVVLIAYGILGDHTAAERSFIEARQVFETDLVSASAWSLASAALLETQRTGTLIVLGSVAGDRGRQSNYIYGAAKAGLATLIAGIAHRLAGSGARAVLVKQGFVDTPMTAAFVKRGPLWAKPETMGKGIVQIANSTRRSPIVYIPWFWRWIMYVIRFMPSSLFHRTKL
jgi:short-subunit dehydrogenase